MVDAVVLAGSRNNSSLQLSAEVEYEALIPINGHIMVEYVVAALRACNSVRNIVVVGSPKDLSQTLSSYDVQITSPGETAMDSVKQGLQALGKWQQTLIVTGDVPLLTPEAIQGFLQQCAEFPADFYYPVVDKETTNKKFPQVRRTYVKLREGVFTGGNLFLIGQQVMDSCFDQAQAMVEARKSPLRLCRLLGFKFLIRFIFHKLTIPELENKISSLFGIRAKAIIVPYPEIGVDVDKPSDLKLVNLVLKELS